MSKPIKDNTCPHCGASSGYYTNSVYRIRQEYPFDEPENPTAFYTKLSGGERMQCLDCNKVVER